MRQAGPLSASGEGLDVDFRPWSEDAEFLTERLEEFNAERWPEHKTWWPLGVWRRDAGVITAGLHGESYAGMMFVKFLWVHERVRRQGIG
ncbi:MAG: hypothetical protein JOZ05_17100, partial [Acetobacteraceae bacterium]|nr:hypothetical protein [Acetobacteraceae bacterium]